MTSTTSPSSSSANKGLSLTPRTAGPPVAKILHTHVCDDLFNRSDVCLVLNTNSVSYKNFGRVASVVEKYTYADVAGRREKCPEYGFYCKASHQDKEGSLIVKEAPIYTEGPAVATIISQFGIGKPIEENKIARKIKENISDSRIKEKLSKDSESNRVKYFKDAINKLKESVVKLSVKKVVFPIGIARSGNVDSCWMLEYLPIIQSFAAAVKERKIETVIIVSETYLNLLAVNFAKRKDAVGQAFAQFKQSTVLTPEDFILDVTVDYENESDDGESVSIIKDNFENSQEEEENTLFPRELRNYFSGFKP